MAYPVDDFAENVTFLDYENGGRKKGGKKTYTRLSAHAFEISMF